MGKQTETESGSAHLTRRQFIAGAAASAASIALADPTENLAPASPLRGRFLTHVSVVRVNQIEVTPTRSIGQDEAADNRPERIRSRREAFARGCPDGKMTWAISWLALNDTRTAIPGSAPTAGRLITIATATRSPSFPAATSRRCTTRASTIAQTIHTALGMISNMVGGGYRPQCLVAGYMDAENQRLLATEEGIHVCQGQIWSQHAIDNGDGDGGICYPYYPSREHYLKPAQGAGRFHRLRLPRRLDLRFSRRPPQRLRGRIQQPHGRRPHRNRRQPRNHRRPQRNDRHHRDALRHAATHSTASAWSPAIWEVSIGHDEDLTWWLQAVRERWPDTRVMTEGAFGLEWRKHTPNNDTLNYRFDAKRHRRPRLRKGTRNPVVHESRVPPRAAARLDHNQRPHGHRLHPLRPQSRRSRTTLQREWSLMNVLNQKGTRPQDKPTRVQDLSPENQHLIYSRYPDLKMQA